MTDLDFIVKMKFGSHVYGTNLSTSDQDFKGIYIPTVDELLLQTGSGQINSKSSRIKNTSEDVDEEYFSLIKFLHLVKSGQTLAIDTLFTPDEFILEKSNYWVELQNNRNKLLSNKMVAFVGYCKSQANKYGLKGSRLRSVKNLVQFLSSLRLTSTLDENLFRLEPYVINSQDTNIFLSTSKSNSENSNEVRHLSVNGKLQPLGITVQKALTFYKKSIEDYGDRTRSAETNEGADLKALYHAVRIAEEAKELLGTGSITFPRPEALYLLAIRRNEIPINEIHSLIENIIVDIDDLQAHSLLPDEVDSEYIDEFIKRVHLEKLKNVYSVR